MNTKLNIRTLVMAAIFSVLVASPAFAAMQSARSPVVTSEATPRICSFEELWEHRAYNCTAPNQAPIYFNRQPDKYYDSDQFTNTKDSKPVAVTHGSSWDVNWHLRK